MSSNSDSKENNGSSPSPTECKIMVITDRFLGPDGTVLGVEIEEVNCETLTPNNSNFVCNDHSNRAQTN